MIAYVKKRRRGGEWLLTTNEFEFIENIKFLITDEMFWLFLAFYYHKNPLAFNCADKIQHNFFTSQ